METVKETLIEQLDNSLTPALRENSIGRPSGRQANRPNKQTLRNGVKVHKEVKGLLYGYDNMARSIQSFMYEGRPGRSKKKVHTVAEMEDFLKVLVGRCWENYNNGVKTLGAYQNGYKD